tara:strand:+ start:759 stop:1076 length:318 start_codon:yes stop_codon:yes gene_type:complete
MKETLTKASLTEQLSIVTGLPKSEAQAFVEAFFNAVSDALCSGQDVKLSGFGKFKLREKTARPGRNPLTMEDVMIEARRVVTWRQGPKLSERIDSYARTENITVE